MAHQLVVHCKRESYDIYIGRPSKWGNPYQSGRDGTRQQVITAYERHLHTRPDLISALPELTGKTSAAGAPRRPATVTCSPDSPTTKTALRDPDGLALTLRPAHGGPSPCRLAKRWAQPYGRLR